MESTRSAKERLVMEASQMSEKVLLRVDEAAALLGVGRSFLYSLVQRGEIDSVKLGRARRIPRQELDAYVRRLQEAESTAEA